MTTFEIRFVATGMNERRFSSKRPAPIFEPQSTRLLLSVSVALSLICQPTSTWFDFLLDQDYYWVWIYFYILHLWGQGLDSLSKPLLQNLAGWNWADNLCLQKKKLIKGVTSCRQQFSWYMRFQACLTPCSKVVVYVDIWNMVVQCIMIYDHTCLE